MSKPQRLFFALWPDHRQRAAIQSVSRDALAASGGRAISAENLHATLVFLGNVPGESLDLLTSVAQTLQARPFELLLDRLDTWRKAGMLVLGASDVPPELLELLGELRRGLSAAGFAVEDRSFRLHVTLARKATVNQRLELDAPVIWPVKDFVLVRSELKPEGSEYTVLRRWPLHDL